MVLEAAHIAKLGTTRSMEPSAYLVKMELQVQRWDLVLNVLLVQVEVRRALFQVGGKSGSN